MKAVVFKDTRRVAVEEVPDAVIEAPTDVVIKVTSSAICGTDLHMYDGRTGATPGLVLGHEPLGVIMETGSAVELVKPGDRVVIPTHLFCGLCFNCIRGYTAACLRVRPGSFGAAYGYAGMGPYRGAQAELLRVPHADANCVVVPGQPGDIRPPVTRDPEIRFETDPGIQTQADWAHLRNRPLGESMVELHAMVTILGCSRFDSPPTAREQPAPIGKGGGAIVS